jgi:dihydroneopterin aldolase
VRSPLKSYYFGLVEDDSAQSSVEVEIRGLSIYTHHGVTDAEQEVGQRMEFDLTLEVPHPDAVLTDRVEDTIDYSEVCDIVALAATERSHRTLERLGQVVAERLMERFDCETVTVRAAKPEPPLHYTVQEAAVEVTLEKSLDREPEDDDAA